MCSSRSPNLTAATSGIVAEVEVGDELGDQQEEEQQPGQAGPGLRDRSDHVVAGLDRAGALAVGQPETKKIRVIITIRLSMNGESPMICRSPAAQRRSRDHRQQRDHRTTAAGPQSA